MVGQFGKMKVNKLGSLRRFLKNFRGIFLRIIS